MNNALNDVKDTAKLKLLDEAMKLPLPGKPDEVWRRIDLKAAGIEDMPSGEPVHVEASYSTGDKADYDEFGKAFESEASSLRAKYLVRANEIWDNRLFALADALSDNKTYVAIPDGMSVNSPVPVRLELPSNGLVSLGFSVEAGKGSRSVVYLEAVQGGNAVVNWKVVVGEGADLTLFAPDAFDKGFQRFECVVREGGSLTIDSVACRGALDMRSFRVYLAGKESRFKLNALTRSEAEQKHITEIGVAHSGVKTESVVAVKSTLRDKSYALFRGTIQIQKDAFGSKGYEENRNLSLSRNARAETLPELEIANSQVECSHAAGVSDIDPVELFYLQSRGISREDAERLIEQSFYRDILSRMTAAKEPKLNALLPPDLTEMLAEGGDD